MRKFFILLLLIVIVFVGNFSLWFLHTRSVHQVLSQLKRELLHNNFNLEYDDIKFTNFKSWRVDGMIQKAKLTHGKDTTTVINLNTIKFVSRLFDKEISLSANDNIEVTTIENKGVKSIFNFVQHSLNSKPKIIINLEISLRDIIDKLKNPEIPKLHLIDSITYNDSGFDVYDLLNNQLFFNVGPSHLSMSSNKNDDRRRFDIDAGFKNLIFNKSYVSPPSRKDFQIHYLELGEIGIDIELTYTQSPSKLLMELINKDKENKKNYKKLFDSYQVDIKKIKQTSSLYDINITGNLDKQPDVFIPNVDMKFSIKKYKNFANYLTSIYNTMLERIFIIEPNFPAKRISHQGTIKLIEVFEEMKPINDDLEVSLTHRNEEGFVIGGKPMIVLLTDLQSVFVHEKKVK